MKEKKCSGCKKVKPISEFGDKKQAGKIYKKCYCRLCEGRRCASRRKPETAKEKYKRYCTTRRSDPSRRPNVALNDCRHNDRKRKWENDLDLEFVQREFDGGCIYCGEKRVLLLGLDRVDNSLGHTKDNVVCACEKCNFLRGDFPFEAFKRLSPILREIREEGLVEDWQPSPRRRKKKD